MNNRLERKAIGTPVSISGDLITNIIDELGRRMISGGERLDFLMGEVIERFKFNDREIYTLRAELNKQGYQLDINDEVWYVPIERRSNLRGIKVAKAYGSRTDDIASAIAMTKADIKDEEKWLKENSNARYLTPQTFYTHHGLCESLCNRLKDLEAANKILSFKQVFANLVDDIHPVTVLGFEEIGGNLYTIVKTADDTKVAVPPTDIQPEGNLSQGIADTNTDTAAVDNSTKEFKLDFSGLKDKNNIQEVKDILSKSGNELVLSLAEATSEAKPENMIVTIISGIENSDSIEGDIKDKILEELHKFEDYLKASDIKGTIKYADFRFPEKSLASSLMTFERIGNVLGKLTAHECVVGDPKVAQSLIDLSAIVKRAQDYIRITLPTADPIYKQAAAVILKNIANTLENINLEISDTSKISETQTNYLIATLTPRLQKIANMFLLIEEE